MNPLNAASLVNLLGFTVGVALYGLLLAMVIRHRQAKESFRPDFLLLAAAILGIVWNVGELFTFIWGDFNHNQVSPLLTAIAFSALHLSGGVEEKSWVVELVAHQCSLPLALVILLQDFRFAFADLFLKRALSLILVYLTAFGLYLFVGIPLLSLHEQHPKNDVQATGILLTLWVATALVYPKLHQFAVWLVDKVVLRRANYEQLRREIAERVEQLESIEEILDDICRRLSVALTADSAVWEEAAERSETGSTVNAATFYAEVFISAVEAPYYKIILQNFLGGRNLLSDEVEMLETVALIAARRIDALRVTRQRHEQEMREQEISKLATEAQLTSLRSQINPHFLFNALTTIGYLIQTAPDKAFQTLMRLTKLLRSLLSSTEEFCPLGEEIKLIRAYLEIEQARFEERLEVEIDVAKDLEKIRVPSLILQPLVENAIKHGISKMARGGEIKISAHLEKDGNDLSLVLSVTDTGAGMNITELPARRKERVGLNNIEQRLRSYYGKNASLDIKSVPGEGTQAEIKFELGAEPSLR